MWEIQLNDTCHAYTFLLPVRATFVKKKSNSKDTQETGDRCARPSSPARQQKGKESHAVLHFGNSIECDGVDRPANLPDSGLIQRSHAYFLLPTSSRLDY